MTNHPSALDRASSLIVVSPKHATDDRIVELSRSLTPFFRRSKKVKSRKPGDVMREVADAIRDIKESK